MSGRCTGWVLKNGPRDRAMRSVLIVIADAANSDGEHSHPGLSNIIEGSLYARAHVLATLKKLEEAKWIEVVGRRSPGRATTFNVLMERPPDEVQSLDLSEPPKGPIDDGQRSNPEGSEVQSEAARASSSSSTVSATVSTTAPSEPAPDVAKPRTPKQLLFEAVADACSIAIDGTLTASARGALNGACRELFDVGATPDEVHVRALRYRAMYPQRGQMTANALAKHWPRLGYTPPVEELERAGAERRPSPGCVLCDGTGWQITDTNDAAIPCACRVVTA